MSTLNSKTISAMCRYARLAPSVHNVQPWDFVITDAGLTIQLNDARLLKAGDPVGRETWISIGACAETLLIAASHYGARATIKSVTKSGVHISFVHSSKVDSIQLKTISARFTDRSVYAARPISAAILSQIERSWRSPRVKLVVSSDRKLIETVSDLTGRGMTMAMQSEAFRTEISGLINRPLTRKSIGFSRESLRVGFFQGLIQPSLAKSKHSVRWHKKQEQARMLSAQALIMSFSEGDTREDWFESGRAYQRAGLTATQLGVRQATSAAVVEASDFHTDIEAMVGTKHRLQTMMRIGYSRKKPVFSPRIRTVDLVKRAT